MILNWDPLIVHSCARPVVKICRSVRDILAILSLQCLFSTLVCTSTAGEAGCPADPKGFLTKIKKLLEMVCHNCGKLLVGEVGSPQKTHLPAFVKLTKLSAEQSPIQGSCTVS